MEIESFALINPRMSAAVCGSKRSFLEDIPSTPSASISKKLRHYSHSSPSSVHFSPPLFTFDKLQSLFPHMAPELLERVLLECGNDTDTTIKRLQELFVVPAEAAGAETGSVDELGTIAEQDALTNSREAAPVVVMSVQNPLATENLPVDGAEWVNLFVREMTTATNVHDAKVRSSMLLEVLEKSISNRAAEETAKTSHTESIMLKEQIEILIQKNRVLKRAVAIQHEHQKEYQDKKHELQHWRQLVSQYQDQLRTLKMNNYALTMHLRETHPSNSIPGRYHPDVF